jgi:uncharacterized protein
VAHFDRGRLGDSSKNCHCRTAFAAQIRRDIPCWMVAALLQQFEVIVEPGITAKPPSVAVVEKAPLPSGSMTALPPASTEEPSVQAKNAGIPATYQVSAGDTLSKIARKRYGDATKWREVESANPGLNLKKLKAGQILYLPNFPANRSMEKRQ